jgi:membrane-bound lytic murein transglycosylase D
LKVAAQLAGTSYDEIAALNPGYNRWASDPDGPHRMLVPIDNADAFETALKSLGPDDRVRFAIHEVTRKDTLAGIAKQYGASAMVIAKINDLKGTQVTPGQSLKIPEMSGQLTDKVLLAASRVDRPETDVGGRKQRQIVYRVRAGETLNSIARRHGMPVSTLARLNNLGAGDTLVKGQRLIIKASTRRLRDEGAGSGRRLTYTVKNGDTVFSISKQFQISVTQLKSWNGLNQHHQIRAGQRLVMYVDANRQQG